MFLITIITLLGRVIARLPESIVQNMCRVGGFLTFHLHRPRRRTILSNLHHAFPEESDEWRRRVALESLQRFFETIFFVIAAPNFSEERFRQFVTLSDEFQRVGDIVLKQNRGGVAILPHFALTEAIAPLPLLAPDLPPVGVVYRPFGKPHIDDWLSENRSRFGVFMFSRDEGFNPALSFIRNGGWVMVLFDQNAGEKGALITMFDRLASATTLPGLMVRKFQVPAVVVYSHRTSFWRASIRAEILDCAKDELNVTTASHRWLERYLSESEDQCANWLWAHNRWRFQKDHSKQLCISHRKSFLGSENGNGSRLSRRTRLWIRMPNQFADAVMALPFLTAIRESRKDLELTLIAQRPMGSFLRNTNLAENVITIPSGISLPDHLYFFRGLGNLHPDIYVILGNSKLADLEAWFTGCPNRFGILKNGKSLSFLSHGWKIPSDLDESETHQTTVWTRFLEDLGLQVKPQFSPLDGGPLPTPESKKVGLICGGTNRPEIRWPVENWRSIIRGLLLFSPDIEFVLYGSNSDRRITTEVAEGFPEENVIDRSGETEFDWLTKELKSCRFVVSGDTGAMHFANAIGVSVVAIYGPTNPAHRGPVFEPPKEIFAPEDSPSNGHHTTEEIAPEAVFARLEAML